MMILRILLSVSHLQALRSVFVLIKSVSQLCNTQSLANLSAKVVAKKHFVSSVESKPVVYRQLSCLTIIIISLNPPMNGKRMCTLETLRPSTKSSVTTLI